MRSNANAPLGAEHMPRQHLPTPWSYPNGSHADTFFLEDQHGCFSPPVDSPLPSLPGTENLPTHHLLLHPLPPYAQRPWYHCQHRLIRAPTSHTVRECAHPALHRLLKPPRRYVHHLGSAVHGRRHHRLFTLRIQPCPGMPGDTPLRQWATFTSKLATIVYKRVGIRKVNISAYHPCTNCGVETMCWPRCSP